MKPSRYHSFLKFAAGLAAAAVLLPGPAARAFPLITNVVETGGDNEATDTITAKWSGVTWNTTIANEPTLNTPVGTPYTVGLFVEDAPAHVDRAHQWNGVTAALPIPPYLLNQEYIMIGNDNRDNTNLRLAVGIAQDAIVYLLVDNRLSDGANGDPPTFDATHMAWVPAQNWEPVINGLNRTGNMSWPDEVGNDNNGDGTGPGGSIQDFFSIYRKFFPAGMNVDMLAQADNTSRGIYGVVIVPAVPPAAPTDIVATAGDSKVILTWSEVAGVNQYVVKRAEVSGGPYTAVATNNGTIYHDTGLANDIDYYYVVAARTIAGDSQDSPEATATPKAAPRNVVAVGGTNQVLLTWDAFEGAASYTVQRADASVGPFTTLDINVTTPDYYLDSPVASGQTYYYVVIAQLAAGGDSGISDAVAATTAPGAPTLTAATYATTVIQLAWASAEPVISQVVVEQSADGIDFTPLTTLDAATKTYLDAGLTAGTTHYYRAQAVNATGPSDYSLVASVTLPSMGWNVNFANATNGQPANNVAPTPVGYVPDLGDVYGDRGNGLFYGWDADNTANGRWRNTSTLPPDLRYATCNHMQKALPAGRSWSIEIPNGFYQVHIVAGESDNFNSVYQFDIEGVATPVVTPTTTDRWAEFTTTVIVNDGLLTVNNGPAIAADDANNNKITYIDIYSAIPVPVEIGTQPMAQTVLENRSLTLSVAVTAGSTPITYQWYKDGVAIEGATGTTLTLPMTSLDQAGDYYVIASNYAGPVTSDTATITVTPDEEPPTVVSAGSADGRTIDIVFSEPVVFGPFESAGDPANYVVNNYAIAVMNVESLGDGRRYVLTLDPAITGEFTVEVNYVFDPSAMRNEVEPGTIVSGMVEDLARTDLGTALLDPLMPGAVFCATNGNFEVIAGGSDLWNASDAGYFLYRPVTGNFDMKVRVESLAPANAWSKAGLMARVATNANSRNIAILIAPTTGQNTHTFQWRDTDGGACGSINKGSTGLTNSPAYPNAWLRLQRVGSVFSGYFSTDGQEWTLYGARDTATNAGGAFPNTLVIGLATTSHDNTTNKTTTAVYQDFYLPPAPQITTQPTPEALVVGIHAGVTYQVVVSNPDNAGALQYQWQFNGKDIPGANMDSLAFTDLAVADSGTYTVLAANDGGAVQSTPVTLTVTNELPVIPGSLSLTTTQGVAISFPLADLLAGTSDPEGDPLTVAAIGTTMTTLRYQADFNAGTPAGSAVYGNAVVSATGGINDSGCLIITPNTANQNGAFLIASDFMYGKKVASFDARFQLKISDGSANAADGMSFNFAPDLVEANWSVAEDGVGTGLSVCIDNYDSNTAAPEAPSVDVKWNGNVVGHQMLPAKLLGADYMDVQVQLSADGLVDVIVDGNNLFAGLPTGYTPVAGRFGFYARTGGEYEAHQVDDLSLAVVPAEPVPMSVGGALITVDPETGLVTYTPPANLVGADSFGGYISDGQLGGTSVRLVNIEIAGPPSIVTEPVSQSVPLGNAATLAVGAMGLQLAYQWYHDGTEITGATSAELNLTAVQPADGGVYFALITNPYGSAMSALATLTVLLPPTITADPQGATKLVGSTVTFSVTATGAEPLSYQWQKDGVAITGAQSDTFTLANLTLADAGAYAVVVANVAGTATSAGADLVVVLPEPPNPIPGSAMITGAGVDAVFAFRVPTQTGIQYTVLYKDDLLAETWTVLTTLTGDGTEQAITDVIGTNGKRFYRIQAVIP